MRYLKFGFVIMLVLVVMTGCKKKEPETQTAPTTVNRDTGSIVIDQGSGTNLPSGSSVQTQSVEEQIQDEQSFVTTLGGDYTNLEYLDTSDWTEFFTDDFAFSFKHVADYEVIEEIPGRFLLTGEGVGDFFLIRVGNDLELPDGTMMRKSNVVINGYQFVLEEYENEVGLKTLAYVTERDGNTYRIEYSYFKGLEDQADLFVKTVDTFTFY